MNHFLHQVHRSICRDMLILLSTELDIKIDCLFFSPNEHCDRLSHSCITESNIFVNICSSETDIFCNELIVSSYYPCGNIILFEEMIYTVFRDFCVPIEALKAFSMAHRRLAAGKMVHLASQCFFRVKM